MSKQQQIQIHKGGYINYDEEKYCSCCDEKRDKNLTRCPIPTCHQKLRTKRHNGKNKSDRWKKKKRY